MERFSFYLVTDTHFFDPSFSMSGPAYERRSVTDQKCVAETSAIIDSGFKQLAEDKETEVILIPGDLVYRGEYQSHIGFRDRLYKLKEQGKKIYIITARHDYDSGDAYEFIGEEMVHVKGMPREELWDFYKDFGFGNSISQHKKSLSYVAQIADGVRLLALNCDGDCKDFKGIWDDQMAWALEQIKDAHNSGNYIFAMTHYPLLPFSPIMNIIGDAKLTDWEKRANEFADAGLDLILTGHMHAQAVTDYKTENGNTITDIQTGCFVGCPCSYRKITLNDDTADIESFTISDFDYDKMGMTAEEYFRWRFDRMIKYKMNGVLPKPAMKLLDKLTLNNISRLLCFKVDDSIKNMLALDLAISFVRNIFIGNEPYVKGTPVYNATDKALSRLKPVLRIVEKKIGAKQPLFSDIKGFVLTSIGDEVKRDYEATIKINRRNRN